MAGIYFMRANTRKSFLYLSIITLGMILLTGSSCNPKQGANDVPAVGTTAQETQPGQSHQDLQPVLDSICRGDFEQASQLVQQASDSPATSQMKQLVDRYFEIEQQRDEKRQIAYQEQLEELEEIKTRVADSETPDVPDVNDIDETMAAVIRAREFAAEDQKAALLNDPFVQNILEQIKVRAAADEQEGKWLDAYAHCYSCTRSC